jgi:hypothetical protein
LPRATFPAITPTFLSLDFIYVPTADVDVTADAYVDLFGADLRWKVRGMGTIVACLAMAGAGPAVLLSGHLHGEVPLLVYRVADYGATVAGLRAGGATEVHELEIPHGPCASFRAPGGQRFAVYQLVRPEAAAYFEGRIDEP